MSEIAQLKGFVMAKDGLGTETRNVRIASCHCVGVGNISLAMATFSISSACSNCVRACRSKVPILNAGQSYNTWAAEMGYKP